MKTLGMIGGTSWVSTVDYYTYINKAVNERLGGISSAKILMYSMNMEEMFKYGSTQDWIGLGNWLSGIVKKLEAGGAEGLVICANTPHIVADAIQKEIKIPLIHIVDETAKEILKNRINKVILLGTKVTMEHDFYKKRMAKFEIETVIPGAEDREFIQTSIFTELGKNIIKPETRKRYIDIIEELKQTTGAGGVILGCTEIPLIIKPGDCSILSFDTTVIHAKAAVEFIFS